MYITLVLFIYARLYLISGMGLPEDDCKTLPSGTLVEILGPAYNPRYMSIEEPMMELNADNAGKRAATENNQEFYVDKDFMRGLGDEPAWEKLSWNKSKVKNQEEPPLEPNDNLSQVKSRRKQRSVKQWGCESKLKWMDLGADFFPRYVRSVECPDTSCWYGHFHCRPRSFTIKILRRRRGRCVFVGRTNALDLIKTNTEDFRELWVWEERAVNFCCDCTL